VKPESPVLRTRIAALSRRLGRLLAENGLTLSVAESCTGGMVGAAVTAVPGSSAYFTGGIISYANEAKRSVLGVPAAVLARNGAVSAETAIAMAAGARRLFSSDCAISITGVAGPGGGTRKKPVGLVYVGIANGRIVRSFEYKFRGSRQEIRTQAVEMAIKKMIKTISD
jgi:nicotinamide-nucleotide amidase